MKKKERLFKNLFMGWIAILAIGFVGKAFQNDTFYTIKIGELISKHGIDMMDHFSFHAGLKYTYPHWLYDLFIYQIYHFFGLTGIYISSIVLFIILLWILFKVNKKLSHSLGVAAFATFIGALALSGFVTARAQLVSFILFALEIYLIEMFLQEKRKKYALGLLGISLLLCNIHVAVWPFYFIVYLPYLAEGFILWLGEKWQFLGKILKKKFDSERNTWVKYLVVIMLLSLVTGLITPIGDTPYTYLIKTMLGNSQNYIQEHQMMSWIDSPFTIIIVFETLFLAVFTKVKLRDVFMVLGLTLMAIFSIRHVSLLALIGTVCFARVFSSFVKKASIFNDDRIINFFTKKYVIIGAFLIAFTFTGIFFSKQLKKDYLDEEFYPIEAVKYIKENVNIEEMRLFNEYNFGSYLLFNDIPVFIDSRADLYTKQFSGFDYDIFDDYEFIVGSYQEKFDFYGITYVLIYNNAFCEILKDDKNYKVLYTDDYFTFFEKVGSPDYVVSYSNNVLEYK